MYFPKLYFKKFIFWKCFFSSKVYFPQVYFCKYLTFTLSLLTHCCTCTRSIVMLWGLNRAERLPCFKIECYTTAYVQKQNTTTYKQVWKRFLSFSFFTPSWNLRKFLIAGELKEHHSLLEISSKAVVWPNIAVADTAALIFFSLKSAHSAVCRNQCF